MTAAPAAEAPSTQWHLARATRGDRFARGMLRAAAAQFYYPMVRQLRSKPKRLIPPSQRNRPRPQESDETPLFKNYFFIPLETRETAMRQVYAGAGLKRILIAGASIAADAEVARLKANEEADGAIPGCVFWRTLFPGCEVGINSGAFAGTDAMLESLPPDVAIEDLGADDKVKLLLLMLGGERVIECPLKYVSRRPIER